mgnify:CR=1 FL=1
MIYKSQGHIQFNRFNNIIYEYVSIDGELKIKPLYRFKQNFPDWINLMQSAIKYLNRYMEQYPNLYNKI